jgi:hypothetical protein
MMKDKSIGLIKCQKAGLENLGGSPCIKRRIRRRAIKDYEMGEHQKDSPPIQRSTYHYSGPHSRIEDYKLKVRSTIQVIGERFDVSGEASCYPAIVVGIRK